MSGRIGQQKGWNRDIYRPFPQETAGRDFLRDKLRNQFGGQRQQKNEKER